MSNTVYIVDIEAVDTTSRLNSINEIFDEFEQGEVWRIDILENDIKINPKTIYDYSKVKEVE